MSSTAQPGIQPATRNTQHATRNASSLALWGGILFSLGFTALIWWAGARLDSIPRLPDQGAAWYYWRLAEPTWFTRAVVWTLYAAHQIAFWWLIYYAQTRVRTYTTGLHPVNVWALGINAAFIIAHFIQSHTTYDALAQDVSIFSSQGSVIILLVLVLIMENPRRGMFFGKRAPLGQEAVRFVRKYHGYFFAWATVYTFWYHPMEGLSGHLVGFFYMFLLLLQGSLFLTRIHVNKWWTLSQEVIVLIHGALVAVTQGAGMWPMFAFGFGGIFVITQMHGLGWSWRVRGAILAVYCALAVLVYTPRGLQTIHQILWIPLIDYLLVFLLAWAIGGCLWLYRRFQATRSLPSQT